MIIPFVVGIVVLGRAFDLYSISTTEHQIIDKSQIELNLQIIPQTCSHKHYRVVKTASDVNEVLGLHPGISLKAKNGDVSLEGLSPFLTTVVDRNKTVEIIMVVDLETETMSFPTRLPTAHGWQERPQSDVGTHYISSIKYGGRLLISLRLCPDKPKHLKDVEKAVAAKIPKSGAIDELFFRDLEGVIKALHHKVKVEIRVVSTIGHFRYPTNVTEVAKAVRKFPEMVRRVKFGQGTPQKFELTDLHRVQSNYSRFEENRELESSIEDANEMLEDLRLGEKIFRGWNETNPTMSNEEEDLVNAFVEQLMSAKQVLSTAITNLRFDGRGDQFDEAFGVYNKLKVNEPYRYSYTLQKCITAISDKSIFGRMYIWFLRWLKAALGK